MEDGFVLIGVHYTLWNKDSRLDVVYYCLQLLASCLNLKASIRCDLQFNDAAGIDVLPNQAIFDTIQLMGPSSSNPLPGVIPEGSGGIIRRLLQRLSGSYIVHPQRQKGITSVLQISQSPRSIFINQSKYALESLKKYDADHAGCQDTRRSTSGSMQLLCDRLVSWSSKRQKSATISSTEAEYIALSGCCAQIL
ncbi:copia protein [Tanacetum coccineum]